MNRIKKAGLIVLVAFLVIQLIQPDRNTSVRVLSTDIINTFDVPRNVEVVLKTACYDCHSNNTNYPWYANIQPAGWILARHIKQGKEELNFSEFGSYSHRKQISKLRSIENSLRDNTMPLSSYTLIHKEARLTKDNKNVIIDWVTRIKDSLMANR